jgi:hypothetical protein
MHGFVGFLTFNLWLTNLFASRLCSPANTTEVVSIGQLQRLVMSQARPLAFALGLYRICLLIVSFLFCLWVASTCVLICLVLLMDGFTSFLFFLFQGFSSFDLNPKP